MAVTQRVVLRGLVAGELHFPIGRLIPDSARGDVLLAVVVEITDGDAFAAEGRIQDGFLEGDVAGGGRLTNCSGCEEQQDVCCDEWDGNSSAHGWSFALSSVVSPSSLTRS